MLPPASRLWSIGLAAWVIQDGNYGDFAVGDRAEFAVELDLHHAEALTAGSAAGAERVKDAQYDVVGRVECVDERAWTLDFGIRAYNDRHLADGLHDGQTIRARIGLSVDPFTYFERLSHRPAVPDLIYTWDVRAIRRETSPYTRSGNNIMVRDPDKLRRIEVSRTDAWRDDDGSGDYVLDCELVPVPPKRTSSTAR